MFLATLFEHTEGLVELRACPNPGVDGKVGRAWTRSPDDVEAFIARWSGKPYGIYFGCGTRSDVGRGSAEDVVELPALWVDLDKVDKTYALKILRECYHPPSLVVDSGGGLHAWWLLDEAAVPGPDFVDLLRALRRIFAGDAAVCDVARIMRLPGTENTKYGDPIPVRVIWESGHRYSFSDLQDWAATQRELIKGTNPFLDAAEKLGMGSAVTIEDMAPGKIHETQLRWSMKAAATGKPEDEIVSALLEATKRAAGQEGERWDWRREEASIRGMIRSAQPKIIQLDSRRKKPAVVNSDKLIQVACLAMEAWGRPLITVDGELWTYESGIWHQFDATWEHRLRVCIQGACEHLGTPPKSGILGDAYRYIHQRPSLVRTGVAWDRQPVVVGDNGALDIPSGTVGPHSQDHYATRRVGYRIDLTATCPTWDRYLAENMGDGVAATLQEWFGAALIRKKSRDLSKGIIIYGPSRTGKTQTTKVFRAMLGGSTCGLPVRAMEEHFGMEPLLRAAGWVADDAVGEREHLQPERYKVIVTGESVSVARKNKQSIEHSFDMPVLLTMNHYPVVKDSSNAVYNRTLVLPMTREWPEGSGEDIGDIIAREEMPGVLNWALAGLQRLHERGRFDPPAGMIAAAKEFKGQNNHLESFAELCLTESPTMYIKRVDMHRIFNNWLMAEIAPRNKLSSKWLTKAMENGPMKAVGHRMNSGWIWCGVRFTEAALAFEEKVFPPSEPRLENLNFVMDPDTYAILNPRKPTGKGLF